MWILFVPFSIVYSITIENIPFYKTPPPSVYLSSSVYDEKLNQIITIGGTNAITDSQKPDINIFDLNSKTFKKLYMLSDYEPKSFSSQVMFLRNDRKILLFGFNSGIYSFSLENFAWSIETTTGDLLADFSSFGYTDFFMNGIQYIALFGGTSEYGASNNLFL